ncbi:MAG: glycosyltransferase [Candidatus Doudnabacteria bacterium]|nr:glycosyltransferase [Candidatus Doudnabacteria bacterium]
MRILLVGGGSGGPVSPLLAVAEKIKLTHSQAKFLLVGTKTGPEKGMAENYRIPFLAIHSGKLRRYFSWQNFLSPVFIIAGFFQSIKIIKDFKPDCVFGAGSFVQVPMVWAAWFLRVPVVIHQQDVFPSLANKLCQLAASKITVTFSSSLSAFASNLGFFYKKKQDKVVLTGNPFRQELDQGLKLQALKEFNLKPDMPTLLVLGGGTGAEFFTKLMSEAMPILGKTAQVIHSTGKGKMPKENFENYYKTEFLNSGQLANAYAAADIVLSRAGLATITELSFLEKLSIIVPMPQSHQEINGAYLLGKEAAIVLPQEKINARNFTNLIRKLIFDVEAQKFFQKNMGKLMPKEGAKKIAEIIIKIAETNNAD